MYKCVKHHCFRIEWSGMYVFQDVEEGDKPLIDDLALEELNVMNSEPEKKLYHCMKGECVETYGGFVRYNKGDSIAKYDKTGDEKYKIVKPISCTDNDNDNDGVMKNMDLCISAGNSRSATDVGAMKDNKLYQRTSTNVIGIAVRGSYIYDEVEGGILKHKIVQCTANGCIYPDRYEGYAQNLDRHTEQIIL